MMQYLKGAFFLLLASLISVLNDINMKNLEISVFNILFIRFFFASIILVPFIAFYRPNFNKKTITIHIARSILFGIGMFFFLIALKNLPIGMVTAINFSIPFFVVIFARLFLKEKIATRLSSVILSMIVVINICHPEKSNLYVFYLLTSSLLFALLDVFNKTLLEKESILSMLFGSSLGAALLYSPFFFANFHNNLAVLQTNFWQTIIIGTSMGIGANLILYFILLAWKCCDISALQPIKYIEFPFALYLGTVLFQETTTSALLIGFGLIFFAFLINFFSEMKNKK